VAEIPIQPKRNKSMLPWIIGAIVLLLVLWLLLGRGDDDDATPAGADTTRTTSSVTDAGRYAGVPLVTTLSWRV